ncbi:aldehyde dehydrogenase [Acholeplasma laidlawii]|uniref:Aldehyde dehydrogenase n=2 Tax=Acholeplasma laidlawii TaxID=2148 RepID=A9NHU4_ACHLI|nr:aldehyde dehydrogenase [Acholeplasma laidlawii]ABX81924.1 aldehyde dehydrogenase [Acholeplasma laidlawii PG-8A]NWH10906.1 aldehyde dehydrogenase [Acholeplasma laidlawii]NWH12292.1 aldehyde dehydrogenase [Acholeplasma laidlawii]NWH13678.1 aldehyde dehydrogenase [Acholeplasma laidlawii]NWH14999.1 aldehyde dehydrogenase [Acholeplasma laidlawii]
METIVQSQKTLFLSGKTLSYEFRIRQLQKLKQLIINYQDEILEALFKDLHKSRFEAYSTEVGYVLKSLTHTIKGLKKWMKPKKVKTPYYLSATSSYITYDALGTILIIGPYNYPFQLIIEPLIGAIAAGNTVMIKPSEFATYTEKILVKLVNNHFDKDYLYVIEGDYTVTSKLLDSKFDHIFFTGSSRVGQIVYEKASKHLTPVTLELGGKSPTIVDETANLKIAAERILFGKFLNAGQTCIAPDYIYVHDTIHDEFINILNQVINTRYSDMNYFGRIINERHYKRLIGLIDETKMIQKPTVEAETKLISPTVLIDVTWDDKVMQEEIFGPILPVLKYANLKDLVSLLKTKDKPLALYLFSNDKKNQTYVFENLTFGGGAINDTIMHVSNPYLPFGGIGMSGIGAYHGFYSFKLFSHTKGYVKKATWFDLPIIYPPYTKFKEKLIRKIFK